MTLLQSDVDGFVAKIAFLNSNIETLSNDRDSERRTSRALSKELLQAKAKLNQYEEKMKTHEATVTNT